MTKILIVDDYEQNRYMLQFMLTSKGYDVNAANNGIEALESARSDPPDLIVSDILMPEMDGFALCRTWQQDSQLQKIPFVFYTATYTDAKDEEFALSLGAARFIIKPMEIEPFVEILEDVIQQAESRRLAVSTEPIEADTDYLESYNAALIRKLESKMLELEGAHQLSQEQARQLEQVLASVPVGVLLLDSAMRIVQVNPVAADFLALLSDVQIGDTLHQLGDRPLTELLTSPPTKGLWHEVMADGHVFELLARPVENAAEPEDWVLVINDVTQERLVRAQLQQQQRLAAVGQLAAGIAHDFNNILASIVLYTQMSTRAEDTPPQERQRMQVINEQAMHATALIQQILDFSRNAVLARRPVALLHLFREQVGLLQRTLPDNIDIDLQHGSDPYLVYADPTRMRQMLVNLAINARDVMPDGGCLRISLEQITLEPGQNPALPEMEAGTWIRLQVTDCGPGITPDVLSHIFEPFFTTKEPGDGSGLGLAQVHGIVGQHDGHITVDTTMGEGTTFSVYLPAIAVQAEKSPVLDNAAVCQRQGEGILIVEDDATLRTALVELFESLGYQVFEAANGLNALSVLEVQGTQVALVLSDIVMPAMGGIALFHALQESEWQIPVILMTGHAMQDELEGLTHQGLHAWMLKPPDLEELTKAVADALRG